MKVEFIFFTVRELVEGYADDGEGRVRAWGVVHCPAGKLTN